MMRRGFLPALLAAGLAATAVAQVDIDGETKLDRDTAKAIKASLTESPPRVLEITAEMLGTVFLDRIAVRKANVDLWVGEKMATPLSHAARDRTDFLNAVADGFHNVQKVPVTIVVAFPRAAASGPEKVTILVARRASGDAKLSITCGAEFPECLKER